MILRQGRLGGLGETGTALPPVSGTRCPVDYIIQRMSNWSLQKHLLTTNTSIVARTLCALEEYLVVGSPEQPSCKAARKEATSPQMDNVVHALTAQSEVIVTIMIKLETMALSSKELL